MTETINDAARFAAARQTLIDAYDRPEEVQHFTFPAVNTFNWARDWFDRYARNRADTAVAGPTLAGGWREVTYHQLSAASDSVALSLLTNGAKPGFRAVIDMPASVELYAVIVGVLKSCGVAIPIHHGLHPEALADRIEIAHPQSVIAAARRFDRQTIGGIAPIDWSAAPQELPSAPLSADAPAFGCFTSGTTGRPKLALHSNRSHAVAHLSSMYWNRLDAGQRHLNVSSPGWAKFFWSSFLVPLTAGATVVIRPDDLTPEGLADFVVEHSVESVCAPVAFLRNCVFRDSGRPSIRDLTSVGEAVPEALRERIAQRWGTRVREGYGQTEATAILGELRARPGRWSVLPGYRVELTQYPGEPAPRLTFAALPGGSFLGYRRPDGTVSPPALTPCGTQWSGDFAAGDIVTGELRILGRGDDVFRSNGHLVAPAELESLLERHESVHAAAVVAAHSDGQSLVPVAYVEADDGADPNEIRVWANSRLQHEVDIASVTVVDDLPRSINGKVQRALLARTAYPMRTRKTVSSMATATICPW